MKILSLTLIASLIFNLVSSAQNAITTVERTKALINDPAPFYTSAVIDGERRVITVRFTNLGTNIRVIPDPILRLGPDAQVTAGLVSSGAPKVRNGGISVALPEPDENLFDPWDLPDPIDDLPLPDPPDTFDDPFDLPDPPPLPDDLFDFPPDPGTEPVDPLGGYAVSVIAEDLENGSKQRTAPIVLESDEQGFDPPIRDIDVILSNAPSNAVQRMQPGSGGRILATLSGGATPMGIAYTRNRSIAYVVNDQSSTISIIQGNTITGTINLPSSSAPAKIVLDATAKRAYVTDLAASGGKLIVVDLVNRSVITTVPTGLHPYAVAITGDGLQVWVTSVRDNNITVIDTTSLKVVGQILNIPHAHGVRFNRGATLAYVAAGRDNAVYVIDTATWATKTSIRVGSNPTGIRLSPSGRDLFVTNRDSGDISQIDTRTNKLVRTFAVGGTPIGTYFIPTK